MREENSEGVAVWNVTEGGVEVLNKNEREVIVVIVIAGIDMDAIHQIKNVGLTAENVDGALMIGTVDHEDHQVLVVVTGYLDDHAAEMVDSLTD